MSFDGQVSGQQSIQTKGSSERIVRVKCCRKLARGMSVGTSSHRGVVSEFQNVIRQKVHACHAFNFVRTREKNLV